MTSPSLRKLVEKTTLGFATEGALLRVSHHWALARMPKEEREEARGEDDIGIYRGELPWECLPSKFGHRLLYIEMF